MWIMLANNPCCLLRSAHINFDDVLSYPFSYLVSFLKDTRWFVCLFSWLRYLKFVYLFAFFFLHPLNVFIINVHLYAILSYLFFLFLRSSPPLFLFLWSVFVLLFWYYYYLFPWCWVPISQFGLCLKWLIMFLCFCRCFVLSCLGNASLLPYGWWK